MAAAAPKRSIFNKPKWAATKTTATTNDGEIGSQAKNVYGAILAAQEERRSKHAAKAAVKAGKERESKRRRISRDSKDEDEDDAVDSDVSKTSSSRSKKSAEIPIRTEGPITRSTPKKEMLEDRLSPQAESLLSPKPATHQTPVIEIDDEEEQEDDDLYGPPVRNGPAKTSPKTVKRIAAVPESESEDEDEYTKDLKRKARDKARLQKKNLDVSKRSSETPQPFLTQESPSKSQDVSSGKSPTEAAPSQSAHDDPIVSIKIKTLVPNTKPLIVNRRASQSMRQVKEVWCQRQGFDAALSSKIYFTWRATKLFNSTTITHILRQLKAQQGSRFDANDARIEVEAVTDEILAYQKQHDRAQMGDVDTDETINAAPASSGNSVGAEGAAPGIKSQPEKERDIVIHLTAQGLETMVLKVRPSTLIAKIMAGFKTMRRVDKEKTPWLMFDGEMLDPQSRVEDTEIEHGDAVDVMIR